MKTIKSIC